MPASLLETQAAWVIRYLFEGGPRFEVSATPTYDDGCEFLFQFAKAFPGRKPDPGLKLAQQRIGRVLSALCERRGPVEWHRTSNHDRYHPRDEPTSQREYRLRAGTAVSLREGRSTPESEARVWAFMSGRREDPFDD